MQSSSGSPSWVENPSTQVIPLLELNSLFVLFFPVEATKTKPSRADNNTLDKEHFVMQICVEPPATAETTATRSESDLRDAIARRARELWEQRGRVEGHAQEDWLQAEAEVMKSRLVQTTPKAAFIVVKFGGFVYTAEYDPDHCGDYRPGEFRKGAPVAVRLADDKIYVRRPNGRELEARILKKQPAAQAS